VEETKLVKVNKNKSRIIKYDVIRVFAVLCVVLCHATEVVYTFRFRNVPQELGDLGAIFSIALHTIGALGIPLFFMLTGALVLKKNFEKNEDVLSFYKRNFLILFIVYVIWIIIYDIFLYYFESPFGITIEAMVLDFLVLELKVFRVMWFFPVILVAYIALPFFSKIVKTYSLKTLSLFILVLFIYSSIIPFINQCFNIFGINEQLNFNTSYYFIGGVYLIYLFFGYYITTQNYKINKILLLVISLISFGMLVFIQFLSYSNISKEIYVWWYDSPLLVICVISLFLLINQFEFSNLSKTSKSILTFVSKISLGIVFSHIIVQSLLKPYILDIEIAMPLKVMIIFILNILICLLINFVLSKNKITAKYLLAIKD